MLRGNRDGGMFYLTLNTWEIYNVCMKEAWATLELSGWNDTYTTEELHNYKCMAGAYNSYTKRGMATYDYCYRHICRQF